jgi:hypothetical protein
MYLMLASWMIAMVGLLGPQAASSSAAKPLDYEYFKTKVQPIFLNANRGGPGGIHARCYTCHSAGTGFRLQRLSEGATTWNEEQSQKNFESAKRMVNAANPAKSRLLLHPLAEAAGGDFFHNGGKHFTSQNDPEFQTLRAWVMGDTAKAQ